MMNRMMGLGLLSLSILAAGCAAKGKHFGEAMTLKSKDTVALSSVLADKETYDGQYVRVRGTVAEVCEKKGCWLTMTDGQHPDAVFVKFNCPIEGRLIPMEAVGRPVVVEGKINIADIDQDTARHYAEDAGASPEQVATIVGPQKQIRIDSPAALIEGL